MSGLSVTRGKKGKRKHIWTVAAEYSKNASGNASLNCPCALYTGTHPPPFVGNNFFCESENPDERQSYPFQRVNDPLWDSQGCPAGSTCCDRGGPWFTTTVTKKKEE